VWVKFGEGQWGEPLIDETYDWVSDEVPPDPFLPQPDEDLTPSADNHIYDIDGPGCSSKIRADAGDYSAYVADFRECVYVAVRGDWRQCSNFYKWHHQLYLQPKNDTELTRAAAGLQKLGGGWIAIPDQPVPMP
jgi:hypothetical protein